MSVKDNPSKFLLDPYMDFVEGEGIPIVEDFGVDLLAVETRPWGKSVV